MGNDTEKKLREWLKEFGCENACDMLVDAGFDSLGMMSSLDKEEMQMLEDSLKDLPPIKQRRIIKKVTESGRRLARSKLAAEIADQEGSMGNLRNCCTSGIARNPGNRLRIVRNRGCD